MNGNGNGKKTKLFMDELSPTSKNGEFVSDDNTGNKEINSHKSDGRSTQLVPQSPQHCPCTWKVCTVPIVPAGLEHTVVFIVNSSVYMILRSGFKSMLKDSQLGCLHV